MNILFVSSEVEPFSKTGGLADVSGALPRALQSLGHDVRVVTPLYRSVDKTKYTISGTTLGEIPHLIGAQWTFSTMKFATMGSGAQHTPVYFVANDYYYNRNGIYYDADRSADFPDNDERYILLSKAALEFCRRTNFRPDIIHCNDWQSGLICAYMKIFFAIDPFFQHTKTIFTIHNLAYQGVFPKHSFIHTGLPWWSFDAEMLEYFGSMNFMKAGLVFADAITTVSRRYAVEIQSEEHGHKLEGLLQKRNPFLHGITNGIDTKAWNPASDRNIPFPYDVNNIAQKYKNKEFLASRFNLPFRWNVPMLGIISRLTGQKGFDIIIGMAQSLLQQNVQLIVLGSGEEKYETAFTSLAKMFPDKVGTYLGFNNELAHLIEAGADMFLMPSQYEPCGLNQMYSLRYGTVPIVRATGGLDDTVENVSEDGKYGTGFKFTNYTSYDLYTTIVRALAFYQMPEVWRGIMLRGMMQDNSWEKAAKEYEALYAKILSYQ
jgi:starch synthase